MSRLFRRRSALLARVTLGALLVLAGCETPPVRRLPEHEPLRVVEGRVPTVAVVTYAGEIDPDSVSDGTFCPHADKARFARFFAAPERILAEEMEASGYPVTKVPASLAKHVAQAYDSRAQVSFVGDSRCDTRAPLFGETQAEDCSVTLRVRVTDETPAGPITRDFQRTGESSQHVPVDAPPDPGPSEAWEAALRDAVRQILADPTAVAFLTGRGDRIVGRGRGPAR